MEIMKDNAGRNIIITKHPFTGKAKKFRGVTAHARGENNFYVLINSARGKAKQRRTIGHELAHIFLGHFDMPLLEDGPDIVNISMFNKKRLVQNLTHEKEADKNARKYYKIYKRCKQNIKPDQIDCGYTARDIYLIQTKGLFKNRRKNTFRILRALCQIIILTPKCLYIVFRDAARSTMDQVKRQGA